MKLRFVVAFLLLFIASPAAAQTVSPTVSGSPMPSGAVDPKRFYQLPSIYIDNATISTIDSANTISGSFTIQNHDPVIQDNIGYQFELVPRVGLDELDYDRYVATETFSLAPNESRVVSFTYPAGVLPLGDYRLRIRALASQGRFLGWSDTNLRFGTPAIPFTVFQPNGVFVGGQAASPSEGVNVNPAQPVTLQGAITSTDPSTLTLIPHVVMYRWDVTGPKVSEQTLAPISVAARTTTPFSTQIIAPATPDAYAVVITLTTASGQRASTNAAYRVVVKGASAKVVVAHFKQQSFVADQPLTIHADITGPADRTNSVAATVTVALTDNGKEVEQQKLAVELGLGITPIEATFTPTKTLTKPGMHISVRDQSNQLLDDYVSTVATDQLKSPTSTSPLKTFFITYWPWIGGGAALVVVLAVLTWWLRRHSRRKALVTAATLIAAAMIGGSLWHASTAQANGIHVQQVYPAGQLRPDITLFINKPFHGATYQGDVPVEFDMEYVNCSNAPTAANVNVNHTNGWVGTPGDNIVPLPNSVSDLNFSINGSTTSCPGGQHLCWVLSGVQTGKIPYSVFGNAQSTIQLAALFWETTQARDLLGRPPIADDVWDIQVNVQPPPAECAPDGTLSGQALVDAHVAGKVFTDLTSPGLGEKGKVTVNNKTSCRVLETLGDYKFVDAVGQPHQKLNDILQFTVPPKTQQTFQIGVPTCTYQIDAYAGHAPSTDQVNIALYPALGANVYDQGNYCTPPPPAACAADGTLSGQDLIKAHKAGQVFTDLAGPNQGDKGNMTVRNDTTCTVLETLGSWQSTDALPPTRQKLLDMTYASVAPKTTQSYHVSIPNCTYNIAALAGHAAKTDQVDITANPLIAGKVYDLGKFCGTPKSQCSDGFDNADPEDTLADAADPGCHTNNDLNQTYNPSDDDETNSDGDGNKKQCSDGIDNNDPEDTLADAADPGCHTDGNVTNTASYNPSDDDEKNSGDNTKCSDGIDNDTDGTIDASDTSCHVDCDLAKAYDKTLNNEAKICDSTKGYPIAEAGIKLNGADAKSNITVTQGQSYTAVLTANADVTGDNLVSRHTAGWPANMAANGKCVWTFGNGSTISNPTDAAACNVNLGTISFNNPAGTYVYNVFQMQDKNGTKSDIAQLTVTVVGGSDEIEQCASGVICIKDDPPPTPTPTPKQCNDGLDNDGDGPFDKDDAGCHPTDHNAKNDASWDKTYDSEVYSITLGPIRETKPN